MRRLFTLFSLFIFTSYPTLNAQNWTEKTKLLASDGAGFDYFGSTVSISGETAIVGAYSDDDALSGSGSAYIYVLVGDTWVEQQKLTASDATQGDNFGYSVAISDDTAIIGAYKVKDGSAIIGAAYVFVRSGTTWTQQQKLSASDAAHNDQFGVAVAIDGDTAIVGANFDDDNGTSSGSVYIFTRSGTSWTEQQKLIASDGLEEDQFGFSISISGETCIVGARYGDDDNYNASGAAYVFTHDGTSWTEQQKLSASDPGANAAFGTSVGLSGDKAVIGTPGGFDGFASGTAYVFTRLGTSWTEQQKLTPSNPINNAYFGESVAISGNNLIIGARGNEAAYAFNYSENTWSEIAILTSSDGTTSDEFGASVSISSENAIIGAYNDDDNGSNSGSAYIFEGSGILGVENQIYKDLKIYPIPTSDKLHIQSSQFAEPIQSINIYNVKGKLVKAVLTPEVSNNTITLDLSTLYSNLYFLQIISNEGTSRTLKFVINN